MIIFVHSYLPIGGAEVLRKNIVDELRRRDAGLSICLITGGGEVADKLQKGGEAVDTLGRSNSIYSPFTTLALARYFRKHKPAIVQSSQFNSNFHTRIAAKIAGVPLVICEEHGVYHWKDLWHRLADRFLAKWCDNIIAVSQAVKDFNVHEIGIPADKIEVLHNCLDTDRSHFTKSSEEVREEFGFSEDNFIVGHIGTLRKEKAHDILLNAFAKFHEDKPNSKLLLIGDGPLKAQLIQQTHSLGLDEAVVFAGNRLDVPDVLKAMDLFVFPSRNEALGIALLEAMYSGLPVIAARTGGIPEVVTDSETGILVKSEDVDGLADEMIHLAGDTELCNRLGNAASQYVAENHSPKAYVDKLLTIYDQLLSQKGLA